MFFVKLTRHYQVIPACRSQIEAFEVAHRTSRFIQSSTKQGTLPDFMLRKSKAFCTKGENHDSPLTTPSRKASAGAAGVYSSIKISIVHLIGFFITNLENPSYIRHK
jgi:hypothetical protein